MNHPSDTKTISCSVSYRGHSSRPDRFGCSIQQLVLTWDTAWFVPSLYTVHLRILYERGFKVNPYKYSNGPTEHCICLAAGPALLDTTYIYCRTIAISVIITAVESSIILDGSRARKNVPFVGISPEVDASRYKRRRIGKYLLLLTCSCE